MSKGSDAHEQTLEICRRTAGLSEMGSGTTPKMLGLYLPKMRDSGTLLSAPKLLSGKEG